MPVLVVFVFFGGTVCLKTKLYFVFVFIFIFIYVTISNKNSYFNIFSCALFSFLFIF
jgi:hypothetical protein